MGSLNVSGIFCRQFVAIILDLFLITSLGRKHGGFGGDHPHTNIISAKPPSVGIAEFTERQPTVLPGDSIKTIFHCIIPKVCMLRMYCDVLRA